MKGNERERERKKREIFNAELNKLTGFITRSSQSIT